MEKIAVVENGAVLIKDPSRGGYLHRMAKSGVVFADLNQSTGKVLLTYRNGKVEITNELGGSYGWIMVDDATLARWFSNSEILVQHSRGRDTVHSANGFGILRYL